MVELSTLAMLDSTYLSTLTEAWNRCWQGYFYEMTFSEENLKVWLTRGQVALQNSIALLDRGKIVGFALLSQDGLDGWVAGTAIDPSYRGQKLFAPMLQEQIDQGKRIGLSRLYLEVLSQNHALRTYQSVGFKYVRDLQIYRITPGVLDPNCLHNPSQNFYEAELPNYFLLRQKARFVPAWQRRAHYLKRYHPVNAWLNFEGTAGMLFGGEKGTTLLDAWAAASDESVRELLTLINHRTGGEFSLTNQPQGLINSFLKKIEILPTALQYEMVYEFIQ